MSYFEENVRGLSLNNCDFESFEGVLRKFRRVMNVLSAASPWGVDSHPPPPRWWIISGGGLDPPP